MHRLAEISRRKSAVVSVSVSPFAPEMRRKESSALAAGSKRGSDGPNA